MNELKDEINSLNKGLSKIKNRRDVYKKRYLKLKSEKKQLKEKILLLQASEPMLEFAKETYKTNWNELKEWLKKEHREDAIKINLSWKTATGKILNKIKELEGSEIDE